MSYGQYIMLKCDEIQNRKLWSTGKVWEWRSPVLPWKRSQAFKEPYSFSSLEAGCVFLIERNLFYSQTSYLSKYYDECNNNLKNWVDQVSPVLFAITCWGFSMIDHSMVNKPKQEVQFSLSESSFLKATMSHDPYIKYTWCIFSC